MKTMTSGQFEKIFFRLAKWKAERHLTIENQVLGLQTNLFEELTELGRATTTEEEIDALCDIIVFTLNVLPHTELVKGSKIDELDLDGRIIPELVLEGSRVFTDSLKLPRMTITALENKSEPFYMNLVEICLRQIYARGYDPYECMLETLQEIESRVGLWDEKIHKFVKSEGYYNTNSIKKKYPNSTIKMHTDHFAVYENLDDDCPVVFPRWYKADYSRCKI